MADSEYSELIEQLKSQGHDQATIERVLEKLRKYDEDTIRQSVFDSIEGGTFDLDAIIQQAIDSATEE